MFTDSYDFVVLYGSQTGQSQAIAESISERAEREHNLKTKLFCLNLFDKEFFIERERYVVVVISSTGDGDNPENADKFCRKIQRKSVHRDFLANVKFALLGLGDTNYNNFCACPKRLEKRFLELGAIKFYASGFCDDATGTELTAEPWIEGLFDTLKEIFGLKMSAESSSKTSLNLVRSSMKDLSVNDEESIKSIACDLNSTDIFHCSCVWSNPSLVYSEELAKIDELKVPLVAQPFLSCEFDDEKFDFSANEFQTKIEYPSQVGSVHTAKLVAREKLTKPGSVKDKYAVFVEINDVEHIDCCAGDAFYFISQNVPDEVDWLLKRLRLNERADCQCTISVLPDTKKKNAALPSYLPSVSTLRYLLTNCVDIRRPINRTMIRILAEHCKDDKEKRRLLELASNEGMSETREYILARYLSILDVLHGFPSCVPPVERLFEHLPRLQPRPLSVAGGTCNGLRFRFVYSLVDIPAQNGRFFKRKGICTGCLTDAPIGSTVRMFFKKPSHFRIPVEANHPMIMVGPGTGVVPFISYLENFELSKCSTENIQRWLFFGCRVENVDFIFGDEMKSFEKNGTLTKLCVSFSQSQSSDDQSKARRYVQDSIREFDSELAELIVQDAQTKIFVCGDAKHMAADVFQAFLDILVKQGKSLDDANSLLKTMQNEYRYVQDVWT